MHTAAETSIPPSGRSGGSVARLICEMAVGMLRALAAGVVYWVTRVLVKVRGHKVVETAVTDVTTGTDASKGQFVTSPGQLSTVTSLVERTVEVISAGWSSRMATLAVMRGKTTAATEIPAIPRQLHVKHGVVS